MIFPLVFSLLILQRITELMIAKRNENCLKKKGAIEFGKKQYSYIVLLHSGFLISLFFEVMVFHKSLSPIWPSFLLAILVTQLLRFWAIVSLGEHWNTKILVLPETNVIRKGPYRFVRHPNYVVVILEILLIPLLFQAYGTAILFSLCNACAVYIRIQEEEKALIEMTNYEQEFAHISRFTP